MLESEGFKLVYSCAALSHNNFSNLRTTEENQIEESNCCLNPSIDIVSRSITMALGNLLYEEKGKQLSARTVDLVEPTAEISGMGNMKYQDVNINTHWTISVRLGQNGTSYAQGRGIMSAENNEVATYSINGIAKPNSSGGGSSSRGVSMFKTTSHSGGKLSQLNDLVSVYELEQDNDGNYTAKVWEWK